jgi:hypothetical protein
MNTNAKRLALRVLVGPEHLWEKRLTTRNLLGAVTSLDWMRTQFLVLFAFFVLGCIPLLTTDPLLPSERPAGMAEELPVNWPTIETHRAQGAEVCGGRIVAAGPHTPSRDVVVVGQDGRTGLMDTGEAWDRNESENEYDDVWVIGVCKKHIER